MRNAKSAEKCINRNSPGIRLQSSRYTYYVYAVWLIYSQKTYESAWAFEVFSTAMITRELLSGLFKCLTLLSPTSGFLFLWRWLSSESQVHLRKTSRMQVSTNERFLFFASPWWMLLLKIPEELRGLTVICQTAMFSLLGQEWVYVVALVVSSG